MGCQNTHPLIQLPDHLSLPRAPHAQQSTCTYEDGVLSYYEIERFVSSNDIKIDPVALAAYARYNTSNWVGFDNEETQRRKMCYVRYRKLGGVFSWDGELDDNLKLVREARKNYDSANCNDFVVPTCAFGS